MDNKAIINLSTTDKVKYDSLMSFIDKYWGVMKIDELILEIKRVFNLEITRGNLDTFRKARGLSPKGAVEASRRKTIKVEIPEKLARAIFVDNWDMKHFVSIEEGRKRLEMIANDPAEGLCNHEIQKYGRTFEVTEEEFEDDYIDKSFK